MDPREEKAKDLANQCKNRWGNSDKAARKGIRRFKRGSNRHSRRLDKIQMGQTASPDDGLPARPPIFRGKLSDTPMSKVLLRKSQERILKLLPPGAGESFVASFEAHCTGNGLLGKRAAAWARFLRGEVNGRRVTQPVMTLADTGDLEEALRDFSGKRGQRLR